MTKFYGEAVTLLYGFRVTGSQGCKMTDDRIARMPEKRTESAQDRFLPLKPGNEASGDFETELPEYPEETPGSKLARIARECANGLSRAERDELLRVGMALIYGNRETGSQGDK
jgi:hypothetical protein